MKNKNKKSAGEIEPEKKGIYVAENLYRSIKVIIDKARSSVQQAVNTAMVEAYWHIGRLIVEDEQKGENRAGYGKLLIEGISKKLTREFGKGFSAQNLWNMRQFYQKFSSMQRELKVNNDKEILSALRRELSWSHYKALMVLMDPRIHRPGFLGFHKMIL